MSLPVALEVTHIDLNKGRVGCRFDNLNRQQQSVIQYFVSAYISGEIIRVNDIMNIVSRNNFTRARNIPDAFAGMSAAEITRHKIKNAMRTGILATIALLLAGYVCMSVYERLFIVRASSASVTAEMLTVDAPVGGKVYFNPIAPDTMVKQGQPLLTVSVPTGNIIAVDSPCDCIVKRRLFENNSVARKADPLLELVRPDAVATVESSIAIEDAVKLSVGDEALLYLPGGNHRIRGEITSIQAGHATKGSSAVMIKPSTAIPAAFIDDPVEVHVDTLNLF
jgi:alginate biosynthesis protein Alg44